MAKPRDYTFEEWAGLPPDTKSDLMLRYWDPRRPEIGESTRLAITEAFAAVNAPLLEQALATTAYFSNWGWCIVVVVKDKSMRVPQRFDVLPVVKGVARGSGPAAFRSARWIHRKRR